MNRKIGLVAGIGSLIVCAVLVLAVMLHKEPKQPEVLQKTEYTDVGGVAIVLESIAVQTTIGTEAALVSNETVSDANQDEVQTEEENEYANFAIADVDDYVNVRSTPSTEGDIVGRIYDGAVAEVMETTGESGEEWYHITSGDVEGYIKAEFFLYGEEAALIMEQYASVSEELTYAKTMEEIRAEQVVVQEHAKIPIVQNIVFPETTYGSNEELRKAIIEYAKQYVGFPYVSGGSSLATGTDCSGFTCFVYADFGYSLDRTPQGQFNNAGRSIDYSEIQPGDIICYSSNGGVSCTHVALYIGDGQIVHAANSRKGVIIGAADYSPIIGIRNVID